MGMEEKREIGSRHELVVQHRRKPEKELGQKEEKEKEETPAELTFFLLEKRKSFWWTERDGMNAVKGKPFPIKSQVGPCLVTDLLLCVSHCLSALCLSFAFFGRFVLFSFAKKGRRLSHFSLLMMEKPKCKFSAFSHAISEYKTKCVLIKWKHFLCLIRKFFET